MHYYYIKKKPLIYFEAPFFPIKKPLTKTNLWDKIHECACECVWVKVILSQIKE